jgi:inosine-uridine nucleoside N-ribohydrolase
VIYDSDIGDDIDDTWALVLLLNCPELDVKLVVGDQGKSEYRAKLFAKLLETAGRTDIPIGVGLDVNAKGTGNQRDWVADYDLQSYPGKVLDDGVQAIIDTIMNSPEPITVIAVGPLPNIRAALEREPRITEKARFVGMHGSVRKGYGGSAKISAEYNVRADSKACQVTLSAPWDVTITPLDTCGLVHLQGEKYAAVRDCEKPLIKALVQNYRIWAKNNKRYDPKRADTASSTLFDTVAVYLAFSQQLCKMETLPIRVTDDGKTVIDQGAKKMQVATEWKNMGRFEDLLVERLTGSD